MFKSVKLCLNQPDVIWQQGKRFELVKKFPYNIGIMGYTKRSSQSVKVYKDKKDGICDHGLSYSVVKQTVMNMLLDY